MIRVADVLADIPNRLKSRRVFGESSEIRAIRVHIGSAGKHKGHHCPPNLSLQQHFIFVLEAGYYTNHS
jgi:hypothetical protein